MLTIEFFRGCGIARNSWNCQDSIFNEAMTMSLAVLLTSILTNHSITGSYILKATEVAIKGIVTCCYDRLFAALV
jgi:hypothetical protein